MFILECTLLMYNVVLVSAKNKSVISNMPHIFFYCFEIRSTRKIILKQIQLSLLLKSFYENINA